MIKTIKTEYIDKKLAEDVVQNIEGTKLRDDKIKCPHCKETILIHYEHNRRSLSKCTECHKEIVVSIKHKETIIKYNITILKVV